LWLCCLLIDDKIAQALNAKLSQAANAAMTCQIGDFGTEPPREALAAPNADAITRKAAENCRPASSRKPIASDVLCVASL